MIKVFIRLFAVCFLAVSMIAPMAVADEAPKMQVYKSATCGCCVKWISHLEELGFEVEATNSTEMDRIKDEQGVPPQMRSCHTGIVNGYVIEGHVPGTDILKLLEEGPDVAGIAVPGMPMGSPGMEGPTSQPYKVYSFAEGEEPAEFASH